MNKSLFSTLLLMFAFSMAVFAQESEKTIKKADKMVRSYSTAVGSGTAKPGDIDKLKEAAAMLETIPATDPYAFYAQQVKGDLHAAYIGTDAYAIIQSSVTGQPAAINHSDKAVGGAEAYVAAYQAANDAMSSADKKVAKRAKKVVKSTVKGAKSFGKELQQVGATMINRAQESNNEDDYAAAYSLYTAITALNAMMKQAGEPIVEDAAAADMQYYRLVTGSRGAATPEENEEIVMALLDANYDNTYVYRNAYDIYKERDEAKALGYLKAGQKRYPEDADLVVLEVNHYLQAGETEKMEQVAQRAIELMPENKSLYIVLAEQVYEPQFQAAFDANNVEDSEKFFNKAVAQYEKVLELQDDYAAAVSGIGLLYYNRGVKMAKAAENITDMKLYDAKKEEADAFFEKARPYFERALKIDGNNKLALQGMRGVAVRQNKMDEAKMYKERLEALGSN